MSGAVQRAWHRDDACPQLTVTAMTDEARTQAGNARRPGRMDRCH